METGREDAAVQDAQLGTGREASCAEGEEPEMDDRQDVVESALNECGNEFTRGVNAYKQSHIEIAPGVIDTLKRSLRLEFKKRLVDEGHDWGKDKQYVLPMAFCTGALAAGYAHNIGKKVTEAHANSAARHVSNHCHGPVKGAAEKRGGDFRPMWVYCPAWP